MSHVVAGSLISIVGPTAVGKTAFGLWLAERLIADGQTQAVSLISADSRQIYRGLEKITGADVPADFDLISKTGAANLATHWRNQSDTVRLYGLSLIEPDEEWSVAHFQSLFQAVKHQADSEARQVLIVGGTGLYHAHLFTADPTLHIPPNLELREWLQTQTVSELHQCLLEKDPAKLAVMNQSDRNNPRRLIRAIEVAEYRRSQGLVVVAETFMASPLPQTMVGLTDSLTELEQKIRLRVQERFQPAVKEARLLLERYPNWDTPAFTATGVKQLRQFWEGQLSETACAEQWALSEFQYAKRQLTWWKKQTQVVWFDIQDFDWKKLAYQHILTA